MLQIRGIKRNYALHYIYIYIHTYGNVSMGACSIQSALYVLTQ